jgi:hypothetical protein
MADWLTSEMEPTCQRFCVILSRLDAGNRVADAIGVVPAEQPEPSDYYVVEVLEDPAAA